MSVLESPRKLFAVGLMIIGGILFVFNLLLFSLYGPPIQNIGDLSIFGLVGGIFASGFVLYSYYGEGERPYECKERRIRQRQRGEFEFTQRILYGEGVIDFGRSRK